MNDETENVPGETDESTSQESETEATSSNDWTVTQETEVVEAITIQDVQSIGSDIIHANLFGSFLICGTLIGLAILRKVHGT